MSEKNAKLLSVLKLQPVVPVLVVDDVKTAVPLARALVAGGLKAIEITLRTTAALEVLNKYPTIAQMPLVSSKYWNMVHGNEPAEVEKDVEGVQTMRLLGENMAYLLKCIEAGRAAGIAPPTPGPRVFTNFIR